jgi:hypothetical protein
MELDHDAIRYAYPNAVWISDEKGAFDKDNNKIALDQSKIDEAAVIVNQEKAKKRVEFNRSIAYQQEADPLFFKYQRGESTKEEWEAKVEEIRNKFPYD